MSQFNKKNTFCQATTTVEDMKTDYGKKIKCLDELIKALISVADVGRSVAEEVSRFADVVLQLAERMDELTVARSDKERAVQEARNNNHFLQLIIQKVFSKTTLQLWYTPAVPKLFISRANGGGKKSWPK